MWCLPTEELKSWASKMNKRLRTAFRHIMQARGGETQPPWYRLLQLAEPVKLELADSQAESTAPADTAMIQEPQESQAAGLVEPALEDPGEEGGEEEKAV